LSQVAKSAQLIQKLFGTFFEATEKLQGPKPASDQAAADSPSPVEAFEKSLAEIAKKRDLVVAGNLHVLNTASIKHKVGDKWPRLKNTIQMNIERIIRRHLKPGDELLNYGELSYVISFASLEEAEASELLQKISRQIIERIFGSEAILQGFELESTAATVSANDVQDGKMSVMQLLKKIDHDGIKQTHSLHSNDNPNEESAPPAAQSEEQVLKQIQAIMGRLAGTMTQLGEAKSEEDLSNCINSLLDQLNAAFFESQELLEQVESGAVSTTPDTQLHEFLETFNQMTALLNQQIAALPQDGLQVQQQDAEKPVAQLETGEAITEEMLSNANVVELQVEDSDPFSSHNELLADFGKDASFQYFPVWDVKLNVVNTYRCSVALTVNGLTKELRSLLPANSPEHIKERLDLITTQKVLADVREAAASDIVCTFGITLRHSLIQNSATRTVLSNMFSSLTDNERQLLVIEITDLDDNTWVSSLLNSVGYLKSFCRAILVRLPRQFSGFKELKAGGVYGVGFHLPDLTGNEASKFQELDRLVIHAERANLTTFVSGVDHTSIAASSVGSGVRYIGGIAVGTPLDFPWGILPFALESIYTRRMSE
jgi:hypothetical protein